MNLNDPAVSAALITALSTLAGVIVTLVGSVAAPMIRDYVKERSERQRGDCVELRDAILAVHAALVTEFAAKAPGEIVQRKVEVGLTAQRLGLLLRGPDAALAELALKTSSALQTEQRTSVIAVWGGLASDWYRGETRKGTDLREVYDRALLNLAEGIGAVEERSPTPPSQDVA